MSPVVRWKSLLVASAAALVLSACGGAEGGESGDDLADRDPVSGGSISMITMSEPRIMDPAVMSNSYATNGVVGNALFGTLLTDKLDGSFDFVLAKSLKSDDGGTTWVLTLRDGLTFSDGSPMDAEDVAFNWERIKDPQLGSQTRSDAESIDSMSPEGQVLTFTLTEPIANFGHAISYTSLNWIAKPEALEAGQAAFDKAPIGAGPFVLDSWSRGGKMILKRNDHYFDDPKPYLDEVVVTANGDEGQRFSTVESGGADATLHSSAAYYKRALEAGLKGQLPGMNGGIAMYFNARFAPFDDPRAREAVAKAIDLEAVNDAAYEGEGEVPKTFFTKDSPFYTDTPLTAYDKDAAQRLFDELADEGKPVTFMITAWQTTESRRVAEAMQAQLSSYKNVNADLEVLDFPAATAKVNAREFQMISGGVGSRDPETAVSRVLFGDSSGNVPGVKDKEMDAALLRGRLSTDIEERKAAYDDMAARFAATNPAILYTRYTSGVSYNPKTLAGLIQYANGSVRLDSAWTAAK